MDINLPEPARDIVIGEGSEGIPSLSIYVSDPIINIPDYDSSFSIFNSRMVDGIGIRASVSGTVFYLTFYNSVCSSENDILNRAPNEGSGTNFLGISISTFGYTNIVDSPYPALVSSS